MEDTNTSYWNPHASQSTYHTSAFAQSLLQRAAPYHAYPTPPPPPYRFSPSSSSLAGALGPVPEIEGPRRSSAQENLKHPRMDSDRFFNTFLDEKARSVTESHIYRDEVGTTSHPAQHSNITFNHQTSTTQRSSLTPFPTSVVTPKKRKQVEVLINTPSKRQNSPDKQLASSRLSSIPLSNQVKSEPPTTPIGKHKIQCYVEVTTPRHRVSQQHLLEKQPPASSPDLGGYAHTADDEYTILEEGTWSTSKKTGDRDDRGEFVEALATD